MRSLTVAVACVSLLLLAVPVGSLAATAPTCTDQQFTDQQDYAASAFNEDTGDGPYTGPSNVPSRVLAGVVTPVSVYIGFADNASVNPPVVTIEAVSGAPLAHPFAQGYTSSPSSSGFDQKIPVNLELADGPAVIKVAFDHDLHQDEMGYCRATVVSPVMTPVDPFVTVSSRYPKRDDIYSDGRTQGIQIIPNRKMCSGPGTLTFTAKYAGRTVTIRAPRCKVPKAFKSGRHGLLMQTFKSDGSLFIWVKRNAEFTGTVRYRITYGTKRVKAGSFRVIGQLHRGRKGRRIYDTNFDSFVNVCINGNYKTYASGGRLYCYVPGRPTYYYQRVDRIH